jgi:hypothetical protein
VTDHYDTAIAKMRQSLAEAEQRAVMDWMADAEVEAFKAGLADLEREAAIWRAKTPEQRAADQAEREAKWEAFDAACTDATEDEDEDEEEDRGVCSHCWDLRCDGCGPEDTPSLDDSFHRNEMEI